MGMGGEWERCDTGGDGRPLGRRKPAMTGRSSVLETEKSVKRDKRANTLVGLLCSRH